MQGSWLIVATLGYYHPPAARTVQHDLQAISDVLAGAAGELLSGQQLSVRSADSFVAVELVFTVRAADELGAAAVADRVRELLAERAFSRVVGDITFGRPLLLEQ